MRNLIIAATAAAAVGFALPAAAQGSGTWNGGQYNQQGADQGQALQQKIQQDLSQAGFTDIHVMPRSFVVSAKDHDGNPVQMMITPHSVTALTAMPRQNEYGQNGNDWNDGSNRGNWNNGYSQNGSNDNGQSYRQSQNGQNENGWNNQNGPMGDNGMSNSARSGNMINSPNGNGSYSR